MQVNCISNCISIFRTFFSIFSKTKWSCAFYIPKLSNKPNMPNKFLEPTAAKPGESLVHPKKNSVYTKKKKNCQKFGKLSRISKKKLNNFTSLEIFQKVPSSRNYKFWKLSKIWRTITNLKKRQKNQSFEKKYI